MVISSADRARAMLLLREREVALPQISDSYGEWVSGAMPEFRWDYPHFVKMQAVLDHVTTGRIMRAYFSIPIRHGKTQHNTIGYAAYRLLRDRRTKVLVASYNQRRANKFSRQIKRLFEAQGGIVSDSLSGAEEWETVEGGGVLAVGAGAGVASVNADLIIIDDPIGKREDAESQAHRDHVWDWITSDILARAEPHTAVLFTMSRWHQDDPAGRLLEQFGDRWHTLDFPGRAEENDPLGRALHAPLWPEVRGEEWLDEKLTELLPYGFASLIQGRPRPREGGFFKWEWWQSIPEVPAKGRMVRYWDLAGTDAKQGSDPDYSASALLCRMEDKRTAIVDVTRMRYAVGRRDYEIEQIAIDDMKKYRGRVSWWFEREAGISGKERMESLVRRIQAVGLVVKVDPPTGSKTARADAPANAVASGNLVLCPGAWKDALLAEAADFPGGRHDDMIDALSGAYAKLPRGVTGEVSSSNLPVF